MYCFWRSCYRDLQFPQFWKFCSSCNYSCRKTACISLLSKVSFLAISSDECHETFCEIAVSSKSVGHQWFFVSKVVRYYGFVTAVTRFWYILRDISVVHFFEFRETYKKPLHSVCWTLERTKLGVAFELVAPFIFAEKSLYSVSATSSRFNCQLTLQVHKNSQMDPNEVRVGGPIVTVVYENRVPKLHIGFSQSYRSSEDCIFLLQWNSSDFDYFQTQLSPQI